MVDDEDLRALTSRKLRQVIVILEGCDGCGKTNVASALARAVGIPIFKNRDEWTGFHDPNYFRLCVRHGDLGFFCAYLEQTGASVIMDRGWPSEWVYSSVFGRVTNEAALDELDMRYAAMGAVVPILLRTDYSRVIDRFEEITPQMLQKIDERYRRFAEWTRCRTRIINVDDEDLERETKEIIELIEEGR